jgi:hypothetical protein
MREKCALLGMRDSSLVIVSDSEKVPRGRIGKAQYGF